MQYKPSEAYKKSGKVVLESSQLQKSGTISDVLEPSTILPLTIKFQPETRLMEAVWQRPVSSHEYRQNIRFIGLCIAALRVKFVLIDFSKMGDPTLEDQQNTNAFLNAVKKKSTLVRSARVLARTGTQQQAYEAVISNGPVIPYQVSFFYDQAEAKEWLLQEDFPKTGLNSRTIHIPLQTQLKALKKYGTSTIAKRPEIAVQPGKPVEKAAPASSVHIIRCKTDFVQITIDKNSRHLQLRWLRRLSSREYRYGILKAARAVVQHNINSILLNNQLMGTLTLEDQAWAVSITVLTLKKSQVERLAIVSAADVMQQMASENMNQRVKRQLCTQTIHYFLGEEEAMDWLNQHHNYLQTT